MKRFILSFGVVAVFVAYSYYVRNQHSEAVIVPIAVNQDKSTNIAATPTTSPANLGTAKYKDGTYDGDSENAFYGNVQVSATIQNGALTSVDFLQYPDENPNSQFINQQAMPPLKQEAIKAQSSKVNIVSGATLTSSAFIQSLATALSQAKLN